MTLDDPVQLRVVECDHRLADERRGRQTRLLVEVAAEEEERPERAVARAQGKLELIGPRPRRADLDDFAVDADQHPAGRAGRLDCGLDDRAQQLVGVVRRGERVTEAGDRFAKAVTLGLELLQPVLQLVGHLVERVAEPRELVATADRNSLVVLTARDRVRGVRDARHCSHDRASLDVRDERDQEERRQQPDQQTLLDAHRRRVDRLLGRDDPERRLTRVSGRRGDENTLPLAVDRDGRRPVGGDVERCLGPPRADDEPALMHDDELFVLAEARPLLRRAEEPLVERDRRDHEAEQPGRAVDPHAPLSGERRADADLEFRRLDSDVGPRADQPLRRLRVAALEGTLHAAVVRKRRGHALGLGEIFAVRGDGGA